MKRWTLRIVLFLVLGCVTTVAVAWGCVANQDYQYPWKTLAQSEAVRLIAELLPTADLEGRWRAELLTDAGNTRRYLEAEERGAPDAALFRIDWFLGLPMRAMTGGVFTRHGNEMESRDIWVWRASDEFDARVFPLRPVFPGFLLNTLFYAGLWSSPVLLTASVIRVQRTLRKRRGRCPYCAYQLRGEFDQGCSECGWKRLEGDA